MRLNRALALGASLLVLLSACSTGGGSNSPSSASASAPAASVSASGGAKAALRIGSDDFYESKLMAELYAQALEAKGYKVERKLGLGSRQVSMPALESGQIDMIPQYIGSTLGFYDKTAPTGDAAQNQQKLQGQLDAKKITVLDFTPAQDQNGFVVRKETADKYSLKTVSDLAKVTDAITWGLPPECSKNPLCGPALKDKYGIEPAKVVKLAACDAPIAQALQTKRVDVAELCTTQPDIARFGFVLLEDDKKSQPADNVAPLVRNDYLDKVNADEFKKILNDVSAKVTTEELTKLGVQVNVDQKDIAEVAKGFLAANGLGK